jgi:Mg2+-importing ATPase
MSVIVHEVLRGRDLLICKGAVEEVLAAYRSVRIGDGVLTLSEAIRGRALELCTGMNEDGLRVIAVACKEVESRPGRQYGVADEDDMILHGFIAFLDPPKESAAPAIAALRVHGVAIKILTGDNELVARKVCRDVGLDPAGWLLGGAVEAMSDAELEDATERVALFAKLTPPQKARIIAALRRRGHTVGYLGDGINDAPALREVDVGISVDTGADIARESADIILLEKSLMILEEGVIGGRATFGNIIKYIKMAASSNFGNMLSVLIASVWLPFLPMLPLQILIQNLLYDLSQTVIPFDRVDPEYLERPRTWQVGDIGRFMVSIGPISSIAGNRSSDTGRPVVYWVVAASRAYRLSRPRVPNGAGRWRPLWASWRRSEGPSRRDESPAARRGVLGQARLLLSHRVGLGGRRVEEGTGWRVGWSQREARTDGTDGNG